MILSAIHWCQPFCRNQDSAHKYLIKAQNKYCSGCGLEDLIVLTAYTIQILPPPPLPHPPPPTLPMNGEGVTQPLTVKKSSMYVVQYSTVCIVSIVQLQPFCLSTEQLCFRSRGKTFRDLLYSTVQYILLTKQNIRIDRYYGHIIESSKCCRL